MQALSFRWHDGVLKTGLPGGKGTYTKGSHIFAARWDKETTVLWRGGTSNDYLLIEPREAALLVELLPDPPNSESLNVAFNRSLQRHSKRLRYLPDEGRFVFERPRTSKQLEEALAIIRDLLEAPAHYVDTMDGASPCPCDVCAGAHAFLQALTGDPAPINLR